MLAALRYNLKIIAPTLVWTGTLVGVLSALILFFQFRSRDRFDMVAAGSLGEEFIPVIAAFFAGGAMDAELKRGAHELLRSRLRPLWHTVAYRLVVAVALALGVGTILLGALYLGIRVFPLGMVLLAAVPPCTALAVVSLWTRVRLGNAFIGYVVAVGAWVANTLTGQMARTTGIALNPLLTFSSYTDRLQAISAGELDTTPYVDWWWVSKIALVLTAALVFWSLTRRIEHLTEGD